MELPRSLELGKLVSELTSQFVASGCSWSRFVAQACHRACLDEHVGSLPHSAAAYLNQLRSQGAPVRCTSPAWTQQRRDHSMQRGPHPSTAPYLHFVEDDMADMIRKGYWVVLPYHLVRHLPNLRISPMGAVPQHERRPRIIVDYSFSNVNQEVDKGAPPEAMQLGRALNRVLHRIATADPADGPVYLMKLDLSDGFYRVPLRDSDIPLLGVAFPVAPGAPPLVAMPLVLPMGWTESPPYFCSATKTIADLANDLAHSTWSPPPHPLEVAAATAPEADTALTLTAPAPPPSQHALHRPVSVPTAHRARRRRRPLRYADVFVDDEILVAQGGPASLNAFCRKLLHLNDRVFRPNDKADDLSIRREPISLKKLDKGDACWATRKIVLGWLIDTLKGTIELPPHRHHRLNHILSVTLASRRVSTKAWHKLLGELRSMVLGIPGGHGLFSQLQLVLRSREHHRVWIHNEARDQLLDLRMLADDLAARPTRIAEVVPAAPHYVGCSDAALSGMGGVWFPPSGGHVHPPYDWREPFPPHIQASLISEQNPRGTITNSDLEIVATIGHVATLAQTHDLRELTVATFSDNTPAVAWGTPRAPSPPPVRHPTCFAPPAYTSGPIATFCSGSTFRAPSMPWPTLPPDASICLMLTFLQHSTLVLPILSLGRCSTCRPICVCDSPPICSGSGSPGRLSPACPLPRSILDPPLDTVHRHLGPGPVSVDPGRQGPHPLCPCPPDPRRSRQP